MNNYYILEQELYETDQLFELRIYLFDKLIKEFPQILYSELNMIILSFINKLYYNEEYGKEIEEMIKYINWRKLLENISINM
jgi:hypothetical protein